MIPDDHPTLFPLPTPAGSTVPARPPVKPRAPSFATPGRKGIFSAAKMRLMEKVESRWKQFFEWSGYKTQEIEIEVTPGRKCKVAVPQGKPPKVIMFRLFPDKLKGTYFVRPISLWGSLIRFNATLCEDLALPIGRTTLWRLIYGGFVDAFRIAPQTTLIDMESLRQHLMSCKIDGEKPPFWTQEKIVRYREWEKITPEMLAKMDAYDTPETEDEK